MKKALLFIVLVAGVNSTVFPFSESWFSLGFENGNFFKGFLERGNTVKSYTGSLVLNLGGYRFWNGKDYGIFIHDLFAFPVATSVEVNGVTTKKDFSSSFFLLQAGMIVGLGFRYDLSEKLKLKYAVGIDFLVDTNIYTENTPLYGNAIYGIQSWNFGIGGDVGVKFDITNTVFLSAGSIFTFDFISFMLMDTPYGESSGWAMNFYMFGVRPYISVGMNL